MAKAKALPKQPVALTPAEAERRDKLPGRLTAREYQVLCLAVQGLSNVEIGASLGISTTGTVKVHMRHILRALHVEQREDLRMFAEYLGVTPGEPKLSRRQLVVELYAYIDSTICQHTPVHDAFATLLDYCQRLRRFERCL